MVAEVRKDSTQKVETGDWELKVILSKQSVLRQAQATKEPVEKLKLYLNIGIYHSCKTLLKFWEKLAHGSLSLGLRV